MPVFHYRQNNSGGYFLGEYNDIYIEAKNVRAADCLAEEHFGVYFNGVDDNRDCECCGDRWYSPYHEEDNFFSYVEFVEIGTDGAVPIFIDQDDTIKFVKIK